MSRQRLDSWKEIAAHLRRNVRTVIRWEKERALPVHRVPGGHGTVYAFTDELDEWLAGRPADTPEPRPWRRLAAAAISLIALVFAGWYWQTRPHPIASVAVAGDAIVARAADDSVLWRFTPDRGKLDVREGTLRTVIRDVDGGAGDEVLAAGMSGWETPEAMLLLSNSGSLRWIQSFAYRLTVDGRQYAPPWRTSDLLAIDLSGSPRFVWVLHHHTWSPAVIAAYDAEGRLVDRYIHDGWLTTARASRDGRFLLATGVNNKQNASILVVLDVRSFGQPLRYWVLPRSELAVTANLPLLTGGSEPRVVVLPSGAVQVRAVDGPPGLPAAETVYEFDERLAFQNARRSDTYWDWHRHLEQTGRVAHAADACKARGVPPPVDVAGRGAASSN